MGYVHLRPRPFPLNQDEGKRKESGCFPNMGKMAECCPEMMGTFFTKMKDCFEGMGEKEKKDTDKK